MNDIVDFIKKNCLKTPFLEKITFVLVATLLYILKSIDKDYALIILEL